MKTTTRTSTDTRTNAWLVSKPEGFYVRLEVAGLPSEEHGPFQTRAEAIDHHTLAMTLFSDILANLFNGDAEITYRMMHDPMGFIRENAPLLRMA
jgi:hypothetical protein